MVQCPVHFIVSGTIKVFWLIDWLILLQLLLLLLPLLWLLTTITTTTAGVYLLGVGHHLSQYLHGSLAGLLVLNNHTEADHVIQCINSCEQKLDFHAINEMETGMVRDSFFTSFVRSNSVLSFSHQQIWCYRSRNEVNNEFHFYYGISQWVFSPPHYSLAVQIVPVCLLTRMSEIVNIH